VNPLKRIAKLQVPLATNSETPEAFLYTKDRKIEKMFPVDSVVKSVMKDSFKKFVYIKTTGDKVEILGEAPWQTW
jgi:hypothetical protein